MKFNNVTVDLISNIYFDGNVTSRNIFFSDGSFKTLGIMLKGEYEFKTSKKINHGNIFWRNARLTSKFKRLENFYREYLF